EARQGWYSGHWTVTGQGHISKNFVESSILFHDQNHAADLRRNGGERNRPLPETVCTHDHASCRWKSGSIRQRKNRKAPSAQHIDETIRTLAANVNIRSSAVALAIGNVYRVFVDHHARRKPGNRNVAKHAHIVSVDHTDRIDAGLRNQQPSADGIERHSDRHDTAELFETGDA